jgi:hypothetical protein
MVGRSCRITVDKLLLQKYLCRKYFIETDFTTARTIHLNRVTVPCVSDLTSHSAPQSSVPSLHAPYLDLLPALFIPEDDHVLPPTKTYTKMSLSSLLALPTPVLA